MPIPIALLAPLLFGGGYAMGEYSRRRAAEQIQRNNVANLATIKEIEKGKEVDESARVLQLTGQAPPAKTAQPRATVPKEAKGVGIPPVEEAELEPEPEAILQPRRAGYEVTPRMLKEYNLNLAKGTMNMGVKENAEFFKLENEKAFAADISQSQEKYLAEGYRPRDAFTKSYIESAIEHGMQGSPSDWKKVYPDMTEPEKYNAARNSLGGYVLGDGIDFERAWQLTRRSFPDITAEARTKIAQELYQLRQAMFLDEAVELVTEQMGLTGKDLTPFQGTAIAVESRIEAGRMAAQDGIRAYLPQEELNRIDPSVTRVEDVPGEAGRVLRKTYGRNTIISHGAIAVAEQQANLEAVDQTMALGIARERGKAGAQAEQVAPLIAGLEEMALALNTQVDLVPRLMEGGKMWAYGLAQKGPYDIQVGDEMVNIGVLVSDYASASKSFLGTLARVFGGERGVLTQQDIERIARALAKLGDSKDVTIRKMKRLRKQMEDIQERANIAAKDPNYTNPNPVLNDEASIRKLQRIVGQKQLIKGAKGSLKSLTKGYE